MYCPGHSGVEGNDRADRLAGHSNPHKWLASGKILSVEKLEILPAGTKPRTSHHRSPGEERRGKRKRQTIFLERTRGGGAIVNAGETSERRGEAHMGFSERTDALFN